ncbi:methyl-accepting chemotaxis protein [Colwellia sp. UCD-KL20]|uniref:methyl-accepting chemotaxis protein n=1 Tax=Colwellia sp. UCD-KL20 TaxID=1917165 RepID=UPI000970A944|nr:methyl-accepting chemotaxis protein [Colwellia sp. UCD-KL20]
MNLTVAIKIIGGFTIISIFLIATSLISLNNLDTIHTSATEQNQVAIPTLKGSNQLANKLSKIGNFTLKGYYLTDLTPLADELVRLNTTQVEFAKELTDLKTVVSSKQELLANLEKVDELYDALLKDVNGVYANRKISIEQKALLTERVDALEEKADDSITMLLDLADHDLADTKLARAVSLGELIETRFNGIVSSSFEYRDTTNLTTISIIEKEILSSLTEINTSITEIQNELNKLGLTDIADELSTSLVDIYALLSGSDSIFNNKKIQIQSLTNATQNLASAENEIDTVNSILTTQVKLADETTYKAGQSVDQAVSDGTTQTTVIMIISIISALGIAWVTLISITRPLSRVNEMLNVVASGDLSKKLDESGHDEFALLAKNCNLLIDSLRNLIQSIVSRSTQLATAAEQTSAVTAQGSTAIEEQRAQVEQAASATTEMSSTSQSVLTSANDALNEIKQADDEAERVKVISERNRHTIETLASEVEDASQVINQLQQDSASIGGILDVIRGIADQTNLLALNAAIEAARAGEHGRGFAVVADEVRTLASRTQESTQEIQTMITALQTGAEKAVSVMDTGKVQASNCVEQSEEAEKALETITHAVHEAYDRSSQIATAAGEQSTVAHEISSNLESIVAIAEQTTAGSKQTADSTNEVAKLAEELQQSVQEFKL